MNKFFSCKKNIQYKSNQCFGSSRVIIVVQGWVSHYVIHLNRVPTQQQTPNMVQAQHWAFFLLGLGFYTFFFALTTGTGIDACRGLGPLDSGSGIQSIQTGRRCRTTHPASLMRWWWTALLGLQRLQVENSGQQRHLWRIGHLQSKVLSVIQIRGSQSLVRG